MRIKTRKNVQSKPAFSYHEQNLMHEKFNNPLPINFSSNACTHVHGNNVFALDIEDGGKFRGA